MAVHDVELADFSRVTVRLAFSILLAEPPPTSRTLPSGRFTQFVYALAARSGGPALNVGADELSRSITFVDEVAGHPPPMTMIFCWRMLPSQQAVPWPRWVGLVRSLTLVNLLPLNGSQKPGWKKSCVPSPSSAGLSHPSPVKKYLALEVRKMCGYSGNSRLPGRDLYCRVLGA